MTFYNFTSWGFRDIKAFINVLSFIIHIKIAKIDFLPQLEPQSLQGNAVIVEPVSKITDCY